MKKAVMKGQRAKRWTDERQARGRETEACKRERKKKKK